MPSPAQRIKNRLLIELIYSSIFFIARSSDATLIRLTNLAEKLGKKDYYVREIQHIRRLFQAGHPSLQVARRILRDTHPNQRRRLIETFIINQMLVGTNKRKAFKESPGGFYPPGFPVVSPTMACNLRCYGCYSGDYQKEKGLSFEVMDRIFTECKEMGMHFAVISGGEPFMNPNLIPIMEKHDDVAFHVFTNGTMIDDRVADRLMEVGNVLPAISIEGYRQETDARRGEGSYQRVLDAMTRLRERRFLFGFSVTMTSENAEVVTSEKFIDTYLEMGAVLGWYFCYMPIGRSPQIELMPTPEQRIMLRHRLEKYRATKPILFGDFWNDGPVVGGCIAAGRKYFHINSNGDIEPCVFMHYSTHNVHETSLKEALQSKLFRSLRESQESNENLLRPCCLIDHPEFSRKAIQVSGALPTHEGAEQLWTEMADQIDEYAQAWGQVAESEWADMPHSRDEHCQHWASRLDG